jgi:hypothetical protein
MSLYRRPPAENDSIVMEAAPSTGNVDVAASHIQAESSEKSSGNNVRHYTNQRLAQMGHTKSFVWP